jgi:hypothetical protein
MKEIENSETSKQIIGCCKRFPGKRTAIFFEKSRYLHFTISKFWTFKFIQFHRTFGTIITHDAAENAETGEDHW